MPLKGQALDGTTFSYPRSVGRLPFHCPHRPTDLGRAPQSVGGNPISMDAGALILFFAFGALRFGDILLFLGYKVPAVLRLNIMLCKESFIYWPQGLLYFFRICHFLGAFEISRNQRNTRDFKSSQEKARSKEMRRAHVFPLNPNAFLLELG